MQSKLHKGINIWSFDQTKPLEACMRLAKDAGFEGIELAMAKSGPLGLDSSEEEIRAVRRLADEIGIKICSLATGLYWQYSLTANPPEIREQAKRVVRRQIDMAALLGVDNSYFEAAELDGATFFQKIRYIVWPLVKPTTLFLLVTGVIGSFQVFMNAYMMTGGGPDNSTTMIGLLIYNNAFTYGKYGLACAQAILLTIVIAFASLFQFKLMGVDVEY